MGKGVIIRVGITLLLWLSAQGVVDGSMSVGDVVLVSAYLTQLYAPLNFLGFVYREIKNALADMERMFSLMEQGQEVSDGQDERNLKTGQGSAYFAKVEFGSEYKKKKGSVC